MKRFLAALLLATVAGPLYAGTRDLKEDTAVTIVVGPFVDSAGAAVTSPTIASIDITAYKNDGTAVTITPAASGTSNDMVHVDDGYFSLELTTTDTSTPGYLRLTFQISGSLIFHEDFNILPANIYDSRYSTDKLQVDLVEVSGAAVSTSTAQLGVNVVNFGGSAGTFASGRPEVNTTHAAGTAWGSGAITAASIAADAITDSEFSVTTDVLRADMRQIIGVNLSNASNGTFGGTLAANFGEFFGDANDTLDAGYPSMLPGISSNTTEILVDTGTSGVVLANDAITAAKIAADAIGASEVAADAIGASEIAADAIAASELAATAVDEIWDEAQAGHTTAGTFGKYLDAAVSGVSTGGVSADDIANAVWDEVLSTGHAVADSAAVRLSDILVDTGTSGVLISSGTGSGQLSLASGVAQSDLRSLGGTSLAFTGAANAAANFRNFWQNNGDAIADDSPFIDHIDTTFANSAAIKTKTDFLPSVTAGASGGVFIAGTNAATSITTGLTANITGNVTGNLSGSVGSVTGAVGSVTGNVGGNVTGTIGGLTAAALKDFFDTDSTTTYAGAVAGSVVEEIAENAAGGGGGGALTGTQNDWLEAIFDKLPAGNIAGAGVVNSDLDSLSDSIGTLLDGLSDDIEALGSVTPIATTYAHKARTWLPGIDGSKAANVVTVMAGTEGTFSAKMPLNDGADIDEVTSVVVTDPSSGNVVTTNLARTADGQQANFDLPELDEAGDYEVVVTVTTLDDDVIVMECTLTVRE